MCGIVGIFSYGRGLSPVDPSELLAIREAMAERGPDGAGLWLHRNGRIGLGHRRLAIIDLSDSGLQPMEIEGGRLRIVFNGEIYNYRELRHTLERKGHHFRSTSDTEVILRLYLEKGAQCVHDLEGMYAFGLWDEAARNLVLARDPFGIKPLYYADDGRVIKFASQVKALRQGVGIDSADDPAGHAGFFLWGSVPEPWTLYKGIKALPAGCMLTIAEDARPALRRFCDIADELAHAEEYSAQEGRRHTASEIGARFRTALQESVDRHLIADVPVGVFLSSGLDSGVITASGAQLHRGGLHTLTMGFREYEGTAQDECPLAEQMARECSTIHVTQRVSGKDFAGDLDNFMAAMDQPSIDGLNTYFVCKAARERGLKVALSGLGGDELLGGYDSFVQVPRSVGVVGSLPFSRAFGAIFRRFASPFLSRFASPKYAGVLEYGGNYAGAYLLRRALFMPWEIERIISPEMAQAGLEELATESSLDRIAGRLRTSKLKVAALEMIQYMRCQLLRDTDWAGMANSIEVRVPLVDFKLLCSLASLIAGRPDLQKRDIIETSGIKLPEQVLRRPKTGFSVPVRQWLGGSALRGSGASSRAWSRVVYARYTNSIRNLEMKPALAPRFAGSAN